MSDLIKDVKAELDAGRVPQRDRMKVYAAMRQVEEFPALAAKTGAVETLLEVVGFEI